MMDWRQRLGDIGRMLIGLPPAGVEDEAALVARKALDVLKAQALAGDDPARREEAAQASFTRLNACLGLDDLPGAQRELDWLKRVVACHDTAPLRLVAAHGAYNLMGAAFQAEDQKRMIDAGAWLGQFLRDHDDPELAEVRARFDLTVARLMHWAR